MSAGAFGYQQSKSKQSSGLNKNQRTYFSNVAPSAYSTIEKQARMGMEDPGGLEFQPVVDQLLPMGQYGGAASADPGLRQWGRDMFTQAAGNRAQRGFNTPYNFEAVAGDAMRMAAPRITDIATNYALQRAQMAPTLRQSSFGYAQAPFENINNILSGSSSGKSDSWGFNSSYDTRKK